MVFDALHLLSKVTILQCKSEAVLLWYHNCCSKVCALPCCQMLEHLVSGCCIILDLIFTSRVLLPIQTKDITASIAMYVIV